MANYPRSVLPKSIIDQLFPPEWELYLCESCGTNNLPNLTEVSTDPNTEWIIAIAWKCSICGHLWVQEFNPILQILVNALTELPKPELDILEPPGSSGYSTWMSWVWEARDLKEEHHE